MKIYFILFCFGLICLTSCTKDNAESNITLNAKWKVYSVKVLSMDTDACKYKTMTSDFYPAPTNTTCQDDDIYNFTNPTNLIIEYGVKKCSQDQTTTSTTTYSQNKDTLQIGGEKYGIVLLERDTLILDNCAKINTTPGVPSSGYGKWGMKLVRVK